MYICDMYKIKRLGSLEETYPNNHKLPVRTRYRERWDGKYHRLFTPIKYKKISEITKDDYVGFKIYSNSKPFDWGGSLVNTGHGDKILKKNLNINDSNFWWFVGRFVADGWCFTYKRKNRKIGLAYSVVLCCGKHEFNEVDCKLKKMGQTYYVSEERTVFKFYMRNQELYEFMSMFGKYAHGKFIPQNVIDLPKELLKHMVDGYISGDGYYQEKNKLYKVSSVSKKLILTMQTCILKVYNVPVKLYYTKRPKSCVIEGRVVNQRGTYELVYKLEKNKQDKAFVEDGWFLQPISEIIKL